MREIPEYPEWDADVTHPVGVVTWNNTERDVKSARLTRALSSSLPSQVAGAADMVSATGAVTWSPDETVDEDLHLPWTNPEIPRRGDTAAIYLGLNDAGGQRRFNRQITGIIDSSSGSVVSGEVEASVVDWIDRFSVRTTMEPLWYRHPAPVMGDPPMAMGLHPCYVTDRVARAARFYATPKLHSDAVLSAPMMGSAWPERGTLTRASGNGTVYPDYLVTPWGLAVSNMDCEWTPKGTLSMAQPVYQHFLVAPPFDSGAVTIFMRFSGGATVVTRFRPSALVVENHLGGQVIGEAGFVLPTITAEEGAEVSIWFDNGHLRVQIKDVLSAAVPLPGTVSGTLQSVRLLTSGPESTGLGGLQIGTAPERRDLHNWTRTALIETVPTGELFGVSAWVDRRALDALKEQASAELAAMWIDEHGRFRYRHRDRLVNGPVVQTITLDNIDDLSWSESWQSVREQINVNFQRPRSTQSTGHRVTVWQGSGESIGINDPGIDELLNVPAEEDWIGVDENMAILNMADTGEGAASRRWFNEGRRSFIAGVIDESDNYPAVVASSTHITHSFRKVNHRAYALTAEVHSFDPAKQLTLKSADDPRLNPGRRNLSTPLVRALAKITWGDETVTANQIGREDTGTLEHDAGRWVQSIADATRLVDYIASWLADPQPILNDVPVTPDDRRQLGDIYVLDLGTRPNGTKRPSLRVLCIGIEDSMTADPVTKTQALTLQVLNTIGG